MDRKSLSIFGLIWAAIFCFIAIQPVFKGEILRVWAGLVSLAFVAVSLLFPKLYEITKFYPAWVKFGGIIGKFNSKIIITLLFYVIFLPIGIVLKILRKDLLGKRIDSGAKSYFIDRKEQPSGMENQF